jgi:DNA-binding NtrC family response regulator
MQTTSWVFASLVGRCEAMEALKARILRTAPSDLRVHIYGETGTGKENVARSLHALSPRVRRRFVAVNLAGFSDELCAGELFGHVRGAFTGAVVAREGYIAEAEGGTLFIDEVADLSRLAQLRLLRFLQEREYQRLGETTPRRADVRVLSATNVDLMRQVREGRFREDLYYRLKEERLVVPPLRERGADVLLLAQHFLRRSAEALAVAAPELGAEARTALCRHAWPGNVRELESEMRRLVVFASGRQVHTQDLSPEIAGPRASACGLRATLRQHEVDLLSGALERAGGVQARAAAELGITRQALSAKLRRLGLTPAGVRGGLRAEEGLSAEDLSASLGPFERPVARLCGAARG